MEAAKAAARAAQGLAKEGAAPGELERAVRLFEMAGDAEGARSAGLRLARALSLRAQDAARRGDHGEAAFDFADAAEAYHAAADERSARECARSGLEAWPRFAEAKRIEVGAQRPASEPAAPKRLRRLPGPSRGEAPSPTVLEEGAPPTVLPTMFMEVHARLLRLGGREAEARQTFEAALAEISREVERRRQRQEWAEALSAASGLLRLAVKAGGKQRLDQARPDFVAVAREAAAEALTAEYFAQGKEDIPAKAMESAALEAHALGNESFAAKYEEEHALVLRRTAELLEALGDGEMAGQALLSWEGHWPVLHKRPDVRKGLLAGAPPFEPRLAAEIEGAAATHPLRAEVDDFLQRKHALSAHTLSKAPGAYAAAARMCVGRQDSTAVELASRGLRLLGSNERGPVALQLIEAQRDAHLAAGDLPGAQRSAAQIERALQWVSDPRERQLREALARAEANAGGSGRAVKERDALSQFLLERAIAALKQGGLVGARLDLESASHLASTEALRWLRVIDLAPDGWLGE